jgi:hypothetical protein
LEVFYKLEVDGEVPLAMSTAEVTGSEVIVRAEVIPEPHALILAAIAMVGAVRCRRLS